MFIPQPYLDQFLECPECDPANVFKNTPDIVLGHLVEYHHSTVQEAELTIQNWMDHFPKDEAENPMQECEEHGMYPLDYSSCPGCDAVDDAIDRWQEDRGVHHGQL